MRSIPIDYPEMGMTSTAETEWHLTRSEAAIIPPVSIREIRDCADRRGHDGRGRKNDARPANSLSGPSPVASRFPSPKRSSSGPASAAITAAARPAELALDSVDIDNAAAHPETWEKVVRKLRTGAMPPAGMPRPDEATYDVAGIVDSRRRSTPRRPRARSPERRGCTASIEPSTRMRFAICWRWRSTPPRCCPPRTSSGGFDNNAGLLGVSPTLLERYLSAAAKISALAVGDATLIGASVADLHGARRCVAERRTSKGCRSGRAAACSHATHFR